MSPGRGRAAAWALGCALALAGCGFGAGPSSKGTVSLSVTRDYGAESLASAAETDPSESETVLRFLDRETDITTRYGGGFVQSINGLAGASSGGRVQDWFFYRNGIESPVGAADVRLSGDDSIWWDYRDWTDAMRVPAVVGSFPQPFVSGAGTGPVPVQCTAPPAVCDRVAAALADDAVRAKVVGEIRPSDGPRVVVGTWSSIRRDPAAALLAGPPSTSGVFARFDGRRLDLLDDQARTAQVAPRRAGLVAALRDGDAPPTWVVTGERAAGVASASRSLTEGTLRNRYAIARTGGSDVALPVGAGA